MIDTAEHVTRIAKVFDERHGFPLDPNLILLAHVGSASHNTYVPKSDPRSIDDVDYMGVVIPPIEYELGLESFEHWVWKEGELDVTLYSLDKFVRLLLKQNPNVLGLLWQRNQDYVFSKKVWYHLKDNRHYFASKDAYASFAGYASSQLHRMTATNNPFQGYMGEKRKALVMTHGYDTKNAAHLIRLLRMGTEFLLTGHMQVFRTDDAAELRSIKRGEWTVECVTELGEKLFARAKAARDASTLPEHPDREGASALLRDIHLKHYNLHGPGGAYCDP